MGLDNNILNEITRTLEDGATNYTVFLEAYEIPITPGATLAAELIERALGKEAVLGSTEDVSAAYVWPVIKNALLYRRASCRTVGGFDQV